MASIEATETEIELDDTELAAWRGMLRVHATLVKALDAELDATHGLPLSSYEVLILLRTAPGRRLRMAELADRTLLSRSGMTRLVDRLERDGLLRRDTCSSDARGCFAVLTDKGAELLSKARQTHLSGVRKRFLGLLSEQQLTCLAGSFDTVIAGNEDLAPEI